MRVLIVFVFFLNLLLYASLPVSAAKLEFILAKAIAVTDISDPSFASISSKQQLVKFKMLDKQSFGQEIFVENVVPKTQVYAIQAFEGKDFLLTYDDDSQRYVIADYYRQPTVIAVFVIFLALLVFLGGSKGVRAIISLVIDALAIIYIFIPMIEKGFDPLMSSVLVCIIAAGSTMALIAGFTYKSLAATIGTTGGVAIAGLLAYWSIQSAPLSGLASTEALILQGNLDMLSTTLNYQGILAAGILIAALGAVMDVAISIASAAQELVDVNQGQSLRELFKHLMNVGRDIMGTMSDTLILAYTGSSIPLFLLLAHESGLRILNMELIATEVIAALVGSIGLICSIPLTALCSAYLLTKHRKAKI